MPENRPTQESLSGPHLQLALFCEKILLEADQTPSYIRVVDRFLITGTTPEMLPTALSFYLAVSFKAGFIRGKHRIKVTPVTPSGVEKPVVEFPALFEGDDRGVLIGIQMFFLAEEEGLYWFRVYFEDALVTQMPLRVIYQRVASVEVHP
jgi:hypothetical protein